MLRRVENHQPKYMLDASDRIIVVNGAFELQAMAHGRPDLGRMVVGRPVTDFISGAEVREVWTGLLRRARTIGAPLRFHYRCDAPHEGRLAVMELRGLSHAHVVLRTRFVTVAPRVRQRLLDPNAARDARLLHTCAWCNRYHVGGWVEVEHAVERMQLFESPSVPQLTHTICERCTMYLDDPCPDLAPDPPL
jgi:hypothetical protein